MSTLYLDFETIYKDTFIQEQWFDIVIGFLRDNYCLIIGSQYYDGHRIKSILHEAFRSKDPNLDPNTLNIQFIDFKIDKFILAS